MKTSENSIKFVENAQLTGGNDRYLSVIVHTGVVLESWRHSLYSFEWLKPDGTIKSIDELPEHEKPKREAIEQKIKSGKAIERPVLGIGIMDNVEIGLGRAEFLTLAAHGVERIAVHILKSNESDFKLFRADIKS